MLDLAPSFSYNTARKFDGAQGASYEELYRGQMFSLFAEYGLTRTVDLGSIAAAVFTPHFASGLQDGGLFVKYRPLYTPLGKAGKFGLLLGTGASFPLTNYEPAQYRRSGAKSSDSTRQITPPVGKSAGTFSQSYCRLSCSTHKLKEDIFPAFGSKDRITNPLIRKTLQRY